MVAVATLTSCNYRDSYILDDVQPSISLIKPVSQNQMAGDTCFISVIYSDNRALHDVYLGLNDLSRMQKKIHYSMHFHGLSFRVDTFYITQPGDTGKFEIQMEASDEYSNRITKRFNMLLQ